MITNKQYKEDMLSIIELISRIGSYTMPDKGVYGQLITQLTPIYNRIKNIPDSEIPDLGGYIAGNSNNDPHDLGNILHIPSEDS